MKLKIVSNTLKYIRTASALDNYLNEKYISLVDEKTRNALNGGRTIIGVSIFEASKHRKADIETAAKAELAARLATLLKDVMDGDVRRGVQTPYIEFKEKDVWRIVYKFFNLGVFDESDIEMAMRTYEIVRKEDELRFMRIQPNLQTYLAIVDGKTGKFVEHFASKVTNQRIANGSRRLADGMQIIDDFNDRGYNISTGRYTLPSIDQKMARSIALEYFRRAKESFYNSSSLLYSMAEFGEFLVFFPFLDKATYLPSNPKTFARLMFKNHN
jgi:hypothetical protein